MNLYGFILFIHILGLISLFGGFALFHRVGARLRSTDNALQAHGWVELLATTRGMFAGGAWMLLLSGVVLAAMRWRGPFPWMATSIVAVLVVTVLNGVILGRWLGAMKAASAAAHASVTSVPPELTRLVRKRGPWILSWAGNGTALGILWLMTNKPGWLGSIAILIVAAAAGAAMGSAVVRRTTT